jgi:Flp pilus assembly protein TadG
MRRRARGERGAVLVITALMLTSLLGVAAILVDLGRVRANARVDQSVVDLAALAAGRKLGLNKPEDACRDAVTYLNANADLSSTINANAFCNQGGHQVASTTCHGGALAQARPSTTVDGATIALHYPVPDAEILDSRLGSGHVNDGTPCQRMRLQITTTAQTLFAGVIGTDTVGSTRSATVRPNPSRRGLTPALWLLDPQDCVALSVSGGSKLTLGATTPEVVPGIMSIDSDGSRCSSNQHTLSSTGAGSQLVGIPTADALIQLFALPDAATVCSAPACDPADVTGGRVSPQPVPLGDRSTRAPVDWVYNCKVSYPNFHGIPINGCPDAPGLPSHLDLLRTAVGTAGAPTVGGFQRWTSSYSCNPSGAVTVTGNWWVDCGTLQIGNGTDVRFSGGNVVFDGGLSMTGGSLRMNDANPVPTLPNACVAPSVTTPCLGNTSAGATLAYVRGGDWNITGGTIALSHTMLYLHAGYLKVAGGAPPTMHAPTEGPFAGLALWAETPSNKFQINGGAGVSLKGAFFAPEAAPFSLSGGGVWGQQNAQFITYQMAIGGGSVLAMAPDPDTSIQAPIRAGMLIR